MRRPNIEIPRSAEQTVAVTRPPVVEHTELRLIYDTRDEHHYCIGTIAVMRDGTEINWRPRLRLTRQELEQLHAAIGDVLEVDHGQ